MMTSREIFKNTLEFQPVPRGPRIEWAGLVG